MGFIRIPFDFKRFDFAIFLFYVINFLLLSALFLQTMIIGLLTALFSCCVSRNIGNGILEEMSCSVSNETVTNEVVYSPLEFVNYKADVEQPLSMIYPNLSGYLIIKAYTPRRNTYLLDFPNREVQNGFQLLLRDRNDRGVQVRDRAIATL